MALEFLSDFGSDGRDRKLEGVHGLDLRRLYTLHMNIVSVDSFSPAHMLSIVRYQGSDFTASLSGNAVETAHNEKATGVEKRKEDQPHEAIPGMTLPLVSAHPSN